MAPTTALKKLLAISSKILSSDIRGLHSPRLMLYDSSRRRRLVPLLLKPCKPSFCSVCSSKPPTAPFVNVASLALIVKKPCSGRKKCRNASPPIATGFDQCFVMQAPNRQHNSGKPPKRRLKPQALRAAPKAAFSFIMPSLPCLHYHSLLLLPCKTQLM